MSLDTKHLADVGRDALENNVRVCLPTDSDDYALYGVDNEFDYIEALYMDWVDYAPQLIVTLTFIGRRIRCAMNPDFTNF